MAKLEAAPIPQSRGESHGSSHSDLGPQFSLTAALSRRSTPLSPVSPRNSSKSPNTYAFGILEHQIARCLTLDAVADSPSKLQKFLTLFAEHFRVGRQEDAHEFLRYVVDTCHNVSLKLHGKLGSTTATTIMSEVFGGELLSQVKCMSCKGESNKTDEIMDVSLDIFQCTTMKGALAKFFQTEVLDGNNMYGCGKCKKLSVAKKQIFMLRAPNVLVIQLKRFEGTGKINRNIDFEETLVLLKFIIMRVRCPKCIQLKLPREGAA